MGYVLVFQRSKCLWFEVAGSVSDCVGGCV